MMKLYSILTLLGIVSIQTAASAQGLFSYDYEIHSLGNAVNSDANDYAPMLSADRKTIFFTSYRSGGSIGEADLYFAKASASGWGQPVNPGSPLNTGDNEGAVSIAGDGKTVAFAADGYSGGYGNADIYLAELTDGRLTNFRNLGGTVNSKYWDSQPTISRDGKTIYFSSARRLGYGGTDIYMTTLDGSGGWSAPVNMGPMINTKKHERSPYITPDGGTIFFSSNGIAGFGGYDVFMSVKDANEWAQPVNLGSIINSDEDELFFTAPSKTERFYFSSSRPGGLGGLDLYYGTPNVFGDGMFHLIVSVLDSATRTPLPSVVTILDAVAGDTVSSFFTNNAAAEYEQILPAGRSYRVLSRVRDQPVKSADVMSGDPNGSQQVTHLYGSISLAEFNLGRYNVPFFVTGYYRPNTKRNLEELPSLLKGQLSEATYIERFAEGSRKSKQYKAYAETIEGIFGTVTGLATSEIFPRFKSGSLPGEVIEISITGYADPQPFVGSYLEEEAVAFVDRNGGERRVIQGDKIGNLELSGLRAWYAGKELDRLFADAAAAGHPEYLELREAGKIRYRYIGGGESLDTKDFAAQRRIHIAISRGNGTEFDINKELGSR